MNPWKWFMKWKLFTSVDECTIYTCNYRICCVLIVSISHYLSSSSCVKAKHVFHKHMKLSATIAKLYAHTEDNSVWQPWSEDLCQYSVMENKNFMEMVHTLQGVYVLPAKDTQMPKSPFQTCSWK